MSENRTPEKLEGIINIVYLNRDNCKITEKNGLLGITAILDKVEDELPTGAEPTEEESSHEPPHFGGHGHGHGHGDFHRRRDTSPAVVTKDLGDGKVEKVADRIHLSRAFPFDKPWEYISVLDRDKKEIGFIRSLEDFDEPERGLLVRELESVYYTPKIVKILSVKERYGFSYWKCLCEGGEKTFTLKDTFRSIVRTYTSEGKLRLFVLDVDGNRYEIPDVEALDHQSYKKIELYL